jgi:hypothetical protein
VCVTGILLKSFEGENQLEQIVFCSFIGLRASFRRHALHYRQDWSLP